MKFVRRHTMFMTVSLIILAAVAFSVMNAVYFYYFFQDDGVRRFTVAVGFCVFLLLITLLYRYGRTIGSWAFRYRFAIGGGLFLLCVIGGISGSSIGLASQFTGTQDTGILFGISRPIRSDEWAVLTPFTLSQYQTGFSYTSGLLRAAATDITTVYALPVMDISMVFHPFMLGYLFLPPAQGLAFFWCGRIIALFLVSFEMMRIITGDRRGLSAVGALLMTLAPLVQWWFAVNGLVEMLVGGQLAIVLFHYYVDEPRFWMRTLLVACMMLCLGMFLFALYPAWEVPLAYLFLVLLAWQVWENRGKLMALPKRDVLVWILGIAILAMLVARTIYLSWDAIQITQNTVYPGQRSSTGGGCISLLFSYADSVALPIFNSFPFSNPCESAAVIDLFPLPYILALIIFFREKNKDFLSIGLFILGAVLILYGVVGFPELLAKVTLFSHSTASRTMAIAGFVGLFLLVRSLSLMRHPVRRAPAAMIAVLTCLLALCSYLTYTSGYLDSKAICAIVLGTVAIPTYLALRYPMRKAAMLFCMVMVVISVYAGAFVNPVRSGLAVVYDSPLYTAVSEVVSEDSTASWAVISDMTFENNLLAIAGAPTINTVNTYPDLALWSKIDLTGKYADIYNRYAHIDIDVVSDDYDNPTFELLSTDNFEVHVTLTQLHDDLGVTYLYTQEDLTRYDTVDIWVEEVDTEGTLPDGMYIYRIETR